MMSESDNRKKAEAILRAMGAMDTLEALPRTGWLIRGVRPCENIAAHCFGAAFMAMLLADAEGGVDTEKVLRMAILHEAGEARTGDLPLTAKKHFPDGAIDHAEKDAARDVIVGLADEDSYALLVEDFVEGQSREAKLVKAADKLQMLCKANFYLNEGKRNLDDFFANDQGMDLVPFPVARELHKLLIDMGRAILARGE